MDQKKQVVPMTIHQTSLCRESPRYKIMRRRECLRVRGVSCAFGCSYHSWCRCTLFTALSSVVLTGSTAIRPECDSSRIVSPMCRTHPQTILNKIRDVFNEVRFVFLFMPAFACGFSLQLASVCLGREVEGFIVKQRRRGSLLFPFLLFF